MLFHRGSSSLYPLPAGHVPVAPRLEFNDNVPRVPANKPHVAVAMVPDADAIQLKLWKLRAMPYDQLLKLWVANATIDAWMLSYMSATPLDQSLGVNVGEQLLRQWIVGLKHYSEATVNHHRSNVPLLTQPDKALAASTLSPGSDDYIQLRYAALNANFELAASTQRTLVILGQSLIRQVIIEHHLDAVRSVTDADSAFDLASKVLAISHTGGL
jgi:hypothetical protein